MSEEWESEIQIWKKKYLSMGLPESLLDKMIQEANEEWNTELGLRKINLFFPLIVNINDTDLEADEFYYVMVVWDKAIIRGIKTTDKTVLFPTLPADTLDVMVFRIKEGDEKPVKKFGQSSIVLSSEKAVDVDMSDVEIVYNYIGFGLPYDRTLQLNVQEILESSTESTDLELNFEELPEILESSTESTDLTYDMSSQLSLNLQYEVS